MVLFVLTQRSVSDTISLQRFEIDRETGYVHGQVSEAE